MPGWKWVMGEALSRKMGGWSLFSQGKELNSDFPRARESCDNELYHA